ncbi:hypothetical protein Tco_0105372 [Tanacetum coccineum]
MDNVRPRGSYSPIKRSYYTKPAFRPKDLKQYVKTFGVQNMTTAGTRKVVNTGKGKMDTNLKKSRWVWRPKGNYLDHVSKDSGSFMLKKVEYVDPKGISKESLERDIDGTKELLLPDLFILWLTKVSTDSAKLVPLGKDSTAIKPLEKIPPRSFLHEAPFTMLSLYITAKVAGKPVNISEASIRSDLLFDDVDGIDSLHNQAIFDAIQLMGHEGDLTVLTFNKALFSPQ